MQKTAIIIYSDPKANSDEALGRLFNAMFLAYELQEKKQDVALIFQGTGVRWVNEITNPDHPAHALFTAVADTVVGACLGCADVFGATEEVRATDVALISEKAIPGTSGVIDLSKYLDDGYQILMF